MKESKFKVGDLVESSWYGTGKVVDVLYSAHKDKYTYEVDSDEAGVDMFDEDDLEPAKSKEYSMDIKIDIAGNVLIATLYESVGGVLKPIAKGHGHLIHEGEIGIAQAASYACNRLWKKIGGIE
jgi:hypothetical protein